MYEHEQERMKALIQTLNQASDAYYNGREELMSNYEWDALFDELLSLEAETGIVLDDSPTNNVSADDIDGLKEEHEFPALSLAKTKSINAFRKWADGRPVWLSVKLDGCTLVATYDDGKLTKLLTRGNGTIGTNITALAPAIQNLPLEIKPKNGLDVSGHMVIRGEAVMSYHDFEIVNGQSEEEYANPRNLVSGTLALKSVEKVRSRKIRWLPFTLVYTERDMNSWGERMNYLIQLGFETVKFTAYHPDGNDGLMSLEYGVQEYTKMVEDGLYDYPADGLVEVYDDVAYAASGSVTGHHATRAGYALKWKDEEAVTKLKYIEWSCAAQCITPVAVFEPVQLEGTTVQRASLANISECRRLNIGDTGSEISVIKANKIIPKVVSVSDKAGNLVIPDTCPVCGSPTKIRVSESGAETLICVNENCSAKKLSQFTRFVSRDGMNIDGVSTSTLEKFVSLGWIHTVVDFYKLSSHFDELKTMPGFGKRSVEKLEVSIEKSKSVTASHLLYALSIPMVGHDVVKRLLQQYNLKELLADVNHAAQSDDLLRYSYIDGIGPEKSTAFVSWFQNDENVYVLNELISYLNVTDMDKRTESATVDSNMAGLTFVVTGNVIYFMNRKELQQYIEAHGGKVSGSVTKKTSYLINNDVNSTSGKNKKAKELGIEILSEDDFMKKFGVEF